MAIGCGDGDGTPSGGNGGDAGAGGMGGGAGGTGGQEFSADPPLVIGT